MHLVKNILSNIIFIIGSLWALYITGSIIISLIIHPQLLLLIFLLVIPYILFYMAPKTILIVLIVGSISVFVYRVIKDRVKN